MTLKINVSRKDIERGHIETYLKQLNMAEKKKTKAKSRVILTFNGYENETRPMHKIAEVCTWVRRFIKNKPNLFYFLDNYQPLFLRSIALCLYESSSSFNLLSPELRVYANPQYEHQKIKECIERLLSSALAYSNKLKEDAQQQDDLKEYILVHSGYYQLNL